MEKINVMKKTTDKIEQQIFEEVDRIGELLEGELHIIDMSDELKKESWGEKQYRIYHSNGYCVDIFKIMSKEDYETGEPLAHIYEVLQEWDGFEEIDEKELLKILKDVK